MTEFENFFSKQEEESGFMSEIVLKGIPAAPGIAYGQSFILDKGEFIVPKRSISSSEIDSEIARFEEAIDNAQTGNSCALKG
jgi:phosphoenolpyruvate-protein kinase (PTS system EI component)